MDAETIVAPAARPHLDRAAGVRRRGRRYVVHVLAMLLAVACKHKTPSSVDRYGDVPKPIPNGHVVIPPRDSLDIRRRADSLAALDPSREARAAIARGDARYLAICNFTCVVIGIVPGGICFVRDCVGFRRNEVITVEGTEQLPLTPDVARLDSITAVYGARYNAIVRDFRSRSARRFPRAAQSAQYRARFTARGLIISQSTSRLALIGAD